MTRHESDQHGRITGRGFRSRQDDAFRALNDSIGFDWRLAPYDVDQSIAHATMLAAQRDHRRRRPGAADAGPGAGPRRAAIRQVPVRRRRRGHPHGDRAPVDRDRRSGRWRLHTARSRNDQVATDVAMFVHAHAQDARERIGRLARTLIVAAERHLDWPMPGYTHLQRAQPVYCRIICWPTSGCSSATATGSRPSSRHAAGCRSAPARWPGSTSIPIAGRSPRAGFHRRRGELDRRRLQP